MYGLYGHQMNELNNKRNVDLNFSVISCSYINIFAIPFTHLTTYEFLYVHAPDQLSKEETFRNIEKVENAF